MGTSLQRAEVVQRAGPPQRIDPVALVFVVAGFVALYLPTIHGWLYGAAANEARGHEVVILLASAWLLYLRRGLLADLPGAGAARFGGATLAFGLLLYVLGRWIYVVRLELISMPLVLAALLLCYRGLSALKAAWFPILFLLFAFPLPYEFVLTVTGPLKEAVSAAATQLLFWLGYPVGRSGVVITIGQYQLLVVEACAGLQTMFTLEAMGLLYTSLMRHGSVLRNTLLAILVVPVSFAANVARVMVLALLTFYLGDDVGQGFLHEFAGVLLFVVGLVLIMALDSILGRVLPRARPVA